jgi:ribonuclease R
MSSHLTVIEKLTVGKVMGISDGSGFARSFSNHSQKIHLSRSEKEVFSGDTVSVQIVGRDRLGRLKGHIEDVLERAHKKMVRRYFKEFEGGFVRVDDARVHQVVRVPTENADDIKDGQVVIVDILQYPSKKNHLLAEPSRL